VVCLTFYVLKLHKTQSITRTDKMTLLVRLEFLALALVGLVISCAHGLKIDFSKLAIHRSPFSSMKRGDSSCLGNPCEASKPFLCRDNPKCVSLKFVCDGTWDCDDGFDEDPAVCNAAARPTFDDMYYFLESEREWMMPRLFNGADIELTAQALTAASDIHDLADQVGMTDENVQLLTQALEGASEGDERPLLKMGMPDRSWHEVQYVLQKLIDSGFQV